MEMLAGAYRASEAPLSASKHRLRVVSVITVALGASDEDERAGGRADEEHLLCPRLVTMGRRTVGLHSRQQELFVI